jgi:hypothetical protein
MTAWNPEQPEKISSTDDFHISPYRELREVREQPLPAADDLHADPRRCG